MKFNPGDLVTPKFENVNLYDGPPEAGRAIYTGVSMLKTNIGLVIAVHGAGCLSAYVVGSFGCGWVLSGLVTKV